VKFAVMSLLDQPEGDSAKATYDRTLDIADAAEELGFDSIWMAEHHFTDYGICPSIPVLGAAIAQRTTRIRIGSAICVLPFHDPRRVAEDYAMLDVLSDGRLDFGAGRGYQPAEFAALGVNMDESRTRFSESLEIIQGLWSQEGFSYSGQHYQFEDLTLHPKPVQKNIPIWVAAVSPESFDNAAEKGYKILAAPQITPLDKVKADHDRYRSGLEKWGHPTDDIEIPMQRVTYIGENEREAKESPREGYMWYHRKNAMRMASGHKGGDSYSFYEKAQQRLEKTEYDEICATGSVLFDTPENVIRRIEHLQETIGLNYLISWVNPGGLSNDLVIPSMERLAKEVIPHFKDKEEA
jgi:natural product biosynthesis luciferase-like monooxygenase protein